MNSFSEPDFVSILKGMRDNTLAQTHCCALAKLVKLHEDTGVVDVQLLSMKAVPKANWDKADKVVQKALDEDYKFEKKVIIKGIPIIVTYCTRPIFEGDNVLLFFHDDCYDSWLVNNNEYVPEIGRKHDYNDAFAVAGIQNYTDNVFIPSEDNMQMEGIDNLKPILKCPYDPVGYPNTSARLKWWQGEVHVGDGVTLCSRNYFNINMWAEGGGIYAYPTISFEVNTGAAEFVVRGSPPANMLKSEVGRSIGEGVGSYGKSGIAKSTVGKVTIGNRSRPKIISIDPTKENEDLNGLEDGDMVFTSDIYRILRYERAIMKGIGEFLGTTLAAALEEDGCTASALACIAFGVQVQMQIMELGLRIDSLFEPVAAIPKDLIDDYHNGDLIFGSLGL